jgi:hypothetical protein
VCFSACPQLATTWIPAFLKGGWITGQLIQNTVDTTSYYEVLDVLLKDLGGVHIDSLGPELISSVPTTAVTKEERKKIIANLQRLMTLGVVFWICTIVGLLVFSINGVIYNIRISLNASDFPDYMVLRAAINW